MQIGFDEFVLDSERHELARNGQPLSISPKAFRLLMMLASAAPGALSREEIYRELWRDVVVEDGNLHNLISELRCALGECAKNPRYIKTLYRFGYRFGVVPENRASQIGSLCAIDWGSCAFPLAEGPNILGRDAAARVRIDSAGVSRRHAVIIIVAGEATIEDQASKNGTFVGGERIRGRIPVHHGDTIRLGSVSVTFRNQPVEASTLTEI